MLAAPLAAARGRRRRSTFEFDPANCARSRSFRRLTVSLEEAVNGRGKAGPVAAGKELNVKIPAGVVTGQQIRLKVRARPRPAIRPAIS